MKAKKKMKKKGKVEQRMAEMSAAEIAQRWVEMRPRYIKLLAFFIVAALSLFLANHYRPFAQTTLNIVNVAFQIFCVFAVLFGTLTAMSFIYGRGAGKQSSP